jgi:N-sulfoglucosamine sulfohydrolase
MLLRMCLLLVSLCPIAASAQTGRARPAAARPDQGLPQRPHILWITCEDMSAHLPSYGDSTVPTPHLDRLAREGVRYRRMFSTSGVCAPSRSAIITGMYPSGMGSNHMRTVEAGRTGNGIINYEAVPDPAVRCFPEYLRAAGYYCTNGDKTDYQFKPLQTTWDVNGKDGQRAPWRGRPAGSPFFSVINLFVTHESQIWARAGEPLRVDPARVRLPPQYPDHPVIRRDVARNYDNIMVMDSLVGVVLRDLEADGLLDSTVVFFYSDHGSGLAWHKRELYDRGLHVPLIVRFPGRRGAGTWEEDLHSFIDLAPTVLSLAGVPLPGHLDGRAFLGPQRAAPRTYVHAARDRMDEHYDCVRAVRDRRFKYLRNYQPDRPYYYDIAYRKQMPLMREILRLRAADSLPALTRRWFEPKPAEELYDLEKDPLELRNLAGDPAYGPHLDRLRAEEQAWVRRTRDKGFMQERDLIELFWPGGEQPATAPPTGSRAGGRLTITCPTAGASIGYRLGAGPWRLYTAPVPVPTSERVTIRAHRIGYRPSEEVTLAAPDPRN